MKFRITAYHNGRKVFTIYNVDEHHMSKIITQREHYTFLVEHIK